MTPLHDKYYSVEEYTELLKHSDERFEYFDGKVVSMSGGKIAHSQIAGNVLFCLGLALENSSSEVFNGQAPLKVPTAPPLRYPDVSVVRGDPVIDVINGIDMLVNPLLIVEVLSPSTEAYDRGEKFSAYQSIPGFSEYLLIAQDRPHITQYVRQETGGWLRMDIMGIDSDITLQTLDVSLSFREIYRKVDFPAPPNPPAA